MAGQVDRERRQAEAQDDGVPGVRVLAAAVQEHHPSRVGAPAQRADRTALHAGDYRQRTGEFGLCGVLAQEGELVEGK